jgi:hypothetical protein
MFLMFNILLRRAHSIRPFSPVGEGGKQAVDSTSPSGDAILQPGYAT